MSTIPAADTVTVALLGNPNTGKSTLFSALVGVAQRIGNYPGVTVEYCLGRMVAGGRSLTVIDLPGTYSLAPRSPDEVVSVDVLMGRRPGVPVPDVIACIVDATNLERNLYLVSQALELNRPLVLVLNKIDLAMQAGWEIDVGRLSERLGVAAVTTEAHRKVGLDDLRRALLVAATARLPAAANPFPPAFRDEVAALKAAWDARTGGAAPRYLVERALLDASCPLPDAPEWGGSRHAWDEIQAARQRLAAAGCEIPGVETDSRYAWVDELVRDVVRQPVAETFTITDRIDAVVTHPVAGLLVFAVLMLVVFQSIFTWAQPIQAAIEAGVTAVGGGVTRIIPAGVLQSLLADGVVAGVGAVVTFVPQIAMLFLFIAILEDCGYMARAAYLMDGLMARIGLSGKSFIPLLSSFACAVPGIMATRVIDNRRDRLLTILVAPLMSCSARLPVYTLMISAFIPSEAYLGGWLGLQSVTIVSLYLLGIVAAILVARLLRKTLLRGTPPPFIMELPEYRCPSWRIVLRRVVEQSWSFIHGAGTLILAVTVIIWAAAYFPRAEHLEQSVRAEYAGELAALEQAWTELRRLPADLSGEVSRREQELAAREAELERTIANHVAGAAMEQSVLGRLGKLIAPLVRPLGWDWKIGCAVIASFPAREVVIGAMGVIYNLGAGEDEASTSLKAELAQQTWPESDRPVFTIPVALSIMVFFALCAQCAATLVIIYKETGSRWWPVFTFAYMTCLAYLGGLVTYQAGTWLSRYL